MCAKKKEEFGGEAGGIGEVYKIVKRKLLKTGNTQSNEVFEQKIIISVFINFHFL